MYPVSQAYKSAVLADVRDWKLKVYIQTAFENFELTGADIVEKSLKVKETVISGTEFSVGGVAAADLSISMVNEDGRFDDVQLNGAIIRPEVGLLIDEDYEWVPLGIFVVDGVESKIKNPARPFRAIDLLAADYMLRFDVPFSKVNIPFPVSAKNLLMAVCQHCGVPLGTSSFLHDNYIIQTRPEGDLTCRDIVHYIAELSCSFARCNRWGQLELSWFKNPGAVQEVGIDANNPDVNVDGGDFSWWNNKTYDGGVFAPEEPDAVLDVMNRYDLSIDDDPICITGVSLETDDGIILAGSDRYAVRIVDNPLIQENAEEIIHDIYERLLGFTYLPFQSNRRDDPAMQAGDMIELIGANGQSYRTIITEYNYVFNGKCLMKAVGVSEVAAGYQYSVDKKISRLRQKLAEKQEQINAMDLAARALFSLFTGVAGGYKIDGDKLGGIHKGRMYLALDDPDIEKAKKVWAYSMAGIFYFENGIYNPPSTGWANDGSALFSLITAAMIRTGILQSLNGKSWINLDDGTFNLGDGSLVYDGESFEAVSAEQVSSKDSDMYARIGTFISSAGTFNGVHFIDRRNGAIRGAILFQRYIDPSWGTSFILSRGSDGSKSFLRCYDNGMVEIGSHDNYRLYLDNSVMYFTDANDNQVGESQRINVGGIWLNFVNGIFDGVG